MKKIDLHIHTVNTQSDPDFEFSLDALKGYVKEKALDATAITNHNLFDEAQFNEIANALAGITTVYPGIEINYDREVVRTNADYITESIMSIRDYGFEGAALCWNLMQAPDAHIEAVAGLENR